MEDAGQRSVQHHVQPHVGLLGHLSTKFPFPFHIVQIYSRLRCWLAPKQDHVGVLRSQNLPGFCVWRQAPYYSLTASASWPLTWDSDAETKEALDRPTCSVCALNRVLPNPKSLTLANGHAAELR